ncbi:hypothetical protein GCM10010515_42380 [Streptomyces fructofermentans]|uniref:DDE Tnp4 domain-containing protein n=1 Tax=Streptomyces fructofermentans TaxID=152141 RepID=A0A918NIM3_9ACTN|nr:hypothetical protein GCM10010515_42380 [Streptomyces fructofermentans]
MTGREGAVPTAPCEFPTGGEGRRCPPVSGLSTSHAKIRALVEQAMAALKTWRLLRRLRYSTTRMTSLVPTVLTLPLACSN